MFYQAETGIAIIPENYILRSDQNIAGLDYLPEIELISRGIKMYFGPLITNPHEQSTD